MKVCLDCSAASMRLNPAGLTATKGEPMADELVSMLAARKGHFGLESGHHGELWLELDSLYLHPARLARCALRAYRWKLQTDDLRSRQSWTMFSTGAAIAATCGSR
jgi:hypothetical protein